MKILVIGSEGFIGGNAVSFFSQKGHEVSGADITLKEAPGYSVINAEFPDFARLFYNRAYDVCINASGAANVQFSFTHAALDYTLNVSNVFHILEAIRQFNPTCKFINFSSAAVYGNPQSLPVTEDAPVNPLSPYGWHKALSEQVCREFYTFYAMPALSLRVFSAYGPGLKKQLFWDFYRKSKKQGVVDIFGTGNESRDFIYIDDLMQAVGLAIENALFHGETVNIANGQEVFIRDAAATYFKLLNKKYTFTGNVKEGDPLNWVADVSVLKSWGYVQKVTIEEGLKKYITWVKESD